MINAYKNHYNIFQTELNGNMNMYDKFALLYHVYNLKQYRCPITKFNDQYFIEKIDVLTTGDKQISIIETDKINDILLKIDNMIFE